MTLNKCDLCLVVFAVEFPAQVGVLYCKAGQSTEEEMYNMRTPARCWTSSWICFGQRVRLKSFTKYRAQLDNKSMC